MHARNLLALALVAMLPCDAIGQAQPSAAAAGFLRAEARLAQGDSKEAIDAYRQALAAAALAAAPDALLIAEIELAIHRLFELGLIYGDARDDLAALRVWSETSAEPRLAALAKRRLAITLARLGRPIEDVRSVLAPLLYLERYRVIGPFDNERGGGFKTPYTPEEEIDLAASYSGKTRSVAWRELPVTPVVGAIELSALFDPDSEAVVYALTYVHSERAQPAALQLGTKDAYRAWVNGHEVASKDVRRPFRHSQDSIGIWLEEGWNRVLFKLAHGKGRWVFAARLSRPDGSPLLGVHEGFPQVDETAVATPSQERETPLVTKNALEALTTLASNDTKNGRAAYLLGTLLRLRRAHDDGEHPDTEWLKRAVQIDPKSAMFHLELAASYRREATIAAQRDENDWRRATEAAADLGAALAAYRLAEYYERQFGNHERALHYLDMAESSNLHYEEAALLRGSIDAARRFPRAAERTNAKLRKLPALSVASRLRLAQSDVARGRLAAAIESTAAIVDADQLQLNAVSRLAKWLLASAQLEAAVEVEKRSLALRPFDIEGLRRIASAFIGRDRHSEALDTIEAALRIRPTDHKLHETKGLILRRLGARDAALASFDEALRLQPNLPRVREYVEFLRNRPDEFASRFRRDTSALIAAAREAARSGSLPAEDVGPARILLELNAVDINIDGTAKEFAHVVTQVLNDQGIRLYDQFSAGYAGGEESLEFKKATVHHADGSVSEARLRRFGGDGGRSDGGYRRGSVDLPPVARGDVIEVEFVREDLKQSFFGDYFGRREVFQRQVDISEKTFILELPSSRSVTFHKRNFTVEPEFEAGERDDVQTYRWTLRDVEKLDAEPGQPPTTEVSPVLEISTFADWHAFGSWYWNLIRKQFESSPEIRRQVRELTSGLDDDLDKVRAIYNYVTTEVRYNAWEFGVHGFKPYNAATIFARKFGDCKDKSTLISVMLNEIGIDSHPVLIRGTQGRGNEDLTLPLVNHFNHCITHVPAADGRPELYLDGTAAHHRLEELPSMDRGAKVFVVTPDGGEIKQVAWNTPGDIALVESTTVAIADDLSSLVDVRIEASGDYSVYVRQAFERDAQRTRELERIFSRRFVSPTVETHNFSRLDDLNLPVHFDARLRIPTYVVETPEGWALPPARDFFSTSEQLTALGALEERRFDVLLGNPRRSLLRTVYSLPDRFTVKSLPESTEQVTEFARLKVSYSSPQPDEIVLERVIEILQPRVKLDSYAKFRQFTATLQRLQEERVLLDRS